MTDLPKARFERLLPASRAQVWKAWTEPTAIARWWGPSGFATPLCEFDARAGGEIRIDMLGPDGALYPMDGRVEEITPPKRLVFVSGALDGGGRRLFDARTVVTLAEVEGSTRLVVEVEATAIHDPAAAAHLAGMEAGWAGSLDRLAACCDARQASFGQFTLRRELAAAPARVFAAFADKQAKAAWFTARNGEWAQIAREMDFRVGGAERLAGRWRSGMVTDYRATFLDIVPDRRIVYVYSMLLNCVRISSSLATVEIEPHGAGAKLRLTEQGAFLDGYDDAGARERGTSDLLDGLEAALRAG